MVESMRDKVRQIAGRLNKQLIQPRFDHSDVAQEAMLQIAKNQDKYLLADTAWLTSIVSGHFCKLQRLHLAKKRSVNHEEFRFLDQLSQESAPNIVEFREQTELMLDCLDLLDDDTRVAIRRRMYDDATFKQLALDLNTTEYGAKTIYESGLAQLLDLMNRQPGNPK